MIHEGQVRNGLIVLDPPAPLPEGALVRVEVLSARAALAERVARARQATESAPALADRLAASAGIATDLPADLAARHDHYIHGSDR
jgi:hypothetical protein